jgi:cell division GTPase FtsZ
MIPLLRAEEQASIYALISDDLKTTDDDAIVRNVMSGFEPAIWGSVSEIAKLRIENKIIRAINDGRYDTKSSRCLAGGLAT